MRLRYHITCVLSRSERSHVCPSNPMGIRAAIFDLDGLMINSEPIALEVWRTTLASFGVVPSPEVYRRVIGLEPIRGVEIFIEAYGLEVRPLDLLQEYWALRTEVMAERVQPRDGLLELMRWFQGAWGSHGCCLQQPAVVRGSNRDIDWREGYSWKASGGATGLLRASLRRMSISPLRGRWGSSRGHAWRSRIRRPVWPRRRQPG